MKRIQAELKGKAQVERDNREIYLEQIKLKAQEQRQTILEGIKYDLALFVFTTRLYFCLLSIILLKKKKNM